MSIPLPLDRPLAVDVRPGGEITVSGSCYLSHDGSVIDAATTSFPKEAPGGASVDAIGLVDAQASGLDLASRDAAAHVAKFVYSGHPSAVCQAAGINGACIVPNTMKLAVDRGLPRADFLAKLKGAEGCLLVDVPPPPPLAPLAPAFPFLGIGAGIGLAVVVGLVAMRLRRKQRESPAGQLLALAKRVQGKLAGADVVVAAPLGRAVETALRALKAGRVDPASAEGKRVASVLLRVETQLDTKAAEARAEQEKEAADELVREVESALEAAEEASALGARTR
jgi:hypothetical protein